MTATTPRSIHLSVRRWFDRANGNSYFAARVYADGNEIARLPFQYGYGSHPQWEAGKAAVAALSGGTLPARDTYLRMACEAAGVAYTEDDVDGCLQRDVKAHGKAAERAA